MSTNPSSTTLPWLWTIEALASFPQVPPSILIDLVKKTPEISDDAGKNAREMVSFRILENMFQNGIGERRNGEGRIGFDVSKSCEDVLRKIMDESSGSKLGMTESERSKWDVQTFISHKRSHLPKCALQQLKDMILKESHPLFSSLKEKSELVTTNQSENITLVNGCHSDALKSTEKGNLISPTPENGNLISSTPEKGNLVSSTPEKGNLISSTPEKGNLISSTPENGANGFQENSVDRNLPTKRDRNGSPIENHKDKPETNEDILENGFDLLLNAAKKLKQRDDQNSVTLSETELVGNGKFPPTEQQVLQPNVPNGTEFRTPNEKTTEKCEPNVRHGETPFEKNYEDEIVSDSEGYDEERTNIANKKHTFLSSQYSQDPMATLDFTELNLCTKCNKGGELLVCSSDVCPLVVHESCLGSSATFDVDGKFYCPFCAYSRAISEYIVLKKKVLSAKKDLMEFIGLGTDKAASKRSSRLKKNQPRQDENPNKNNEINKNGGETQHKEQVVHECEGGKSSRTEKNKTLNGKGVLHKPVNNSSREPVGPSDDIETCSEEENDKSGCSSYPRRTRKIGKQFKSPALHMMRRKAIKWSKIEEDKLKEGVERFSNADNRINPWTDILEFGQGVFLKERTAMDLKDKWRNICKKNSKSK